MRRLRPLWGRVLAASVLTIMALSTGVATVSLQGHEVVAGHTTFATLVRVVSLQTDADRPPVEYGLATQRESWLLGLHTRTRPMDDSSERMVFVWSPPATDPTENKILAFTGQFARLTDAGGHPWTIHEFTYLDGGELRYTYGVKVGPARDRPDGEAGKYNWALTYRPDHLFQEPATASPTLPFLPDPLPEPVAGVERAPDPSPREIRFSLGPAPPLHPAAAIFPSG